MLGSAEREKVRLIICEIIFQEFQIIFMTTISERHRQTDERTTCHGNTARCYAEHGKYLVTGNQ